TYDIISRTMFSNDVRMDFRAMSRALSSYFENVGRVDFAGALGLPDWVPTPRRLRALPALRFFRREMHALIERRKNMLRENSSNAPRDLLTLLLTARDPDGGALFGEEEVYDNVLTFIFAGYETTANALSWTFYLLSQYPEWDVRVAAEARLVVGDHGARADDVDRLVTLRMVLEEAMRLYPPAPLMAPGAVGADPVCG